MDMQTTRGGESGRGMCAKHGSKLFQTLRKSKATLRIYCAFQNREKEAQAMGVGLLYSDHDQFIQGPLLVTQYSMPSRASAAHASWTTIFWKLHCTTITLHLATFAIPQACIINTKLEIGGGGALTMGIKFGGGGGTRLQCPSASSTSDNVFYGPLDQLTYRLSSWWCCCCQCFPVHLSHYRCAHQHLLSLASCY